MRGRILGGTVSANRLHFLIVSFILSLRQLPPLFTIQRTNFRQLPGITQKQARFNFSRGNNSTNHIEKNNLDWYIVETQKKNKKTETKKEFSLERGVEACNNRKQKTRLSLPSVGRRVLAPIYKAPSPSRRPGSRGRSSSLSRSFRPKQKERALGVPVPAIPRPAYYRALRAEYLHHYYGATTPSGGTTFELGGVAGTEIPFLQKRARQAIPREIEESS